jgi:hypothetical protein
LSKNRSSSTGTGMTSVLFFSAATSTTVCSSRSCNAAGSRAITLAAAARRLEAWYSPSAVMIRAWRSRSASAWRDIDRLRAAGHHPHDSYAAVARSPPAGPRRAGRPSCPWVMASGLLNNGQRDVGMAWPEERPAEEAPGLADRPPGRAVVVRGLWAGRGEIERVWGNTGGILARLWWAGRRGLASGCWARCWTVCMRCCRG